MTEGTRTASEEIRVEPRPTPSGVELPSVGELREIWGETWSFERRPALIGQAPSATGDPTKPCTGSFGARIAGLLGAETHEDYVRILALFWRRNVIPRFPGSRDGKGDRFPIDEARERARTELLPALREKPRVAVLCGKTTVARAFGVEGPYFSWTTTGGVLVAPFPHPSGVNRFWNSLENQRRASRFLRDVVTGEGVPGV